MTNFTMVKYFVASKGVYEMRRVINVGNAKSYATLDKASSMLVKARQTLLAMKKVNA